MSHTRQRTTLTPAGDSTSKTSILFVCCQAVSRRQRPLLRLHRQPRQQPPQPLHRALLPPLHQGRRPRRDLGRRPGRVPHRGRDPKPPVGNGGDSNRSVVRLQPILQHQRLNLALPWPLIASVNEASPCRVLSKRPGGSPIPASACPSTRGVPLQNLVFQQGKSGFQANLSNSGINQGSTEDNTK